MQENCPGVYIANRHRRRPPITGGGCHRWWQRLKVIIITARDSRLQGDWCRVVLAGDEDKVPCTMTTGRYFHVLCRETWWLGSDISVYVWIAMVQHPYNIVWYLYRDIEKLYVFVLARGWESPMECSIPSFAIAGYWHVQYINGKILGVIGRLSKKSF